MKKILLGNALRTASLMLVCAILAISATGCGNSSNDDGSWIESEYTVYDYEDGGNSGTVSGSSQQQQNNTTTQQTIAKDSKNASPASLKDPNVTIFWPITIDDHPEFTAINKAFEEKYGGKVTVVGAGFYDDRAVRLTNLIQSKTQVDVVSTGIEDYPSYPVSKLVRPIDTAQFDFSQYPYTFNNDKDSYTKLGGDSYFVKSDPDSTTLLLYNKTLFENAGLKTPLQYYQEGNWNWNTFRDLARTLSQDTDGDGNNDVYGFADYDINAFLCSNGTSLLNYDGTSFTVNSDERVKHAYQLYFDMFNVDKSICTDPWSWSTDMKQGKLAMVCQKPMQMLYWMNQGSKYSYDFAPLPMGSDAKEYYKEVTGTQCFSLGATCKNPEGAYAYMKFYIEQSNGRLYNESTGNAKYTDDQVSRIKEYNGLSSNGISPTGFGNLKMDARSLLWEIRGGKSVGSTLEYWNNVLQQDINIALMTN